MEARLEKEVQEFQALQKGAFALAIKTCATATDRLNHTMEMVVLCHAWVGDL
jgi:galactose-1-phosphate uridylyltransferase